MSSLFEFDPDRMAGSGIITRGTAGEALGNRQLVYEGADTFWYLADADAAATMPTIGLTLHAITAGNRGQILLHGYIGDSTWTWTIGGMSGLLYASTTPGAITQTAPTLPDLIQVVGTAKTTTIIYFNPFPPSEGPGTVTMREEFYGAPNADAAVGDHAGQTMMDGVDTYIRRDIYIPVGFHTLSACHVIVTQGIAVLPNIVWTCDTDWGQICVGEDYLEDSDSTGATSALPQDDLVCLDISAALTGIAAGDLVGVSFMRDGDAGGDTVGGNVYYLGIRLRYT